MSKQINIGGRIHSTEVGNVSVGANEVLDDTKGKKQNVINSETDAELLRLDQSKQNNLTFDNTPTENSNNPVKSSGVYVADKALSDAIEAILLLIPSAATALNQLADKAFVNSSVSTATATFRGTYNVVTDLELAYDATHEQIATKLGQVIATADNNDYAFVQVPVSATSTDIRRTERYKFNGTAWGYEYDLNTSGFTAAQWEAINSAITAALVQKLVALPTAQELAAALLGKQDVLTFDNVPTTDSSNPVKSGGVKSAINDEKVARENADTGLGNRITAIENVIPSAASSSNKLVDNSTMSDAIGVVTALIGQMDATFNLTTTDGHITLHVTQVDGVITLVQVQSSDIASAAALTLVANDLSALTTRVGTAEGNITSLTGRVSTNETDIANLQQLYNNLQQSKPEPVTALPETGQQQGVIYRLAGTTSYSDYMWNGSTWVLMATYNNAIDPRPKKASQNLVTSGGVFDNMGALDVSELNATENPHTLAQYADLPAALAAIPTDYQKGGMSIKFVQSSDNKYMQFRLMSDSFNTTVANWQGVDDVPTAGSDNLVKSGGVADAIVPVTGVNYDFEGVNGSYRTYSVNLVKGVCHVKNTTGNHAFLASENAVILRIDSTFTDWTDIEITQEQAAQITKISSIIGSGHVYIKSDNINQKIDKINEELEIHNSKISIINEKLDGIFSYSGEWGKESTKKVLSCSLYKGKIDINIENTGNVNAYYNIAFLNENNIQIGNTLYIYITAGSTGNLVAEPSELVSKVALWANTDNVYGNIVFRNNVCLDVVAKLLSENILNVNNFAGKKVSILGDSISTYTGYSHAFSWYEYGHDDRHGLTSVSQTWWMDLLNRLGCTLEINDSIAGALISSSGPDPLTVLSNPIHYANNALGNPDIILIFAGVNDFGSNKPLGTFNDEYIPEGAEPADLLNFIPSVRRLIYGIIDNYPLAKIVFITPLTSATNASNGYSLQNTSELFMSDYVDAMKKACAVHQVQCVDLFSLSNISVANKSTFVDTDQVHPIIAGMKLISDTIYSELTNNRIKSV